MVVFWGGWSRYTLPQTSLVTFDAQNPHGRFRTSTVCTALRTATFFKNSYKIEHLPYEKFKPGNEEISVRRISEKCRKKSQTP